MIVIICRNGKLGVIANLQDGPRDPSFLGVISVYIPLSQGLRLTSVTSRTLWKCQIVTSEAILWL